MTVAPIIGADADSERADLHADTTGIGAHVNLCTRRRCGKKDRRRGSNSKPKFSHVDLLIDEERNINAAQSRRVSLR
jgi:hypothetical protein